MDSLGIPLRTLYPRLIAVMQVLCAISVVGWGSASFVYGIHGSTIILLIGKAALWTAVLLGPLAGVLSPLWFYARWRPRELTFRADDFFIILAILFNYCWIVFLVLYWMSPG